MPAIVENLPVLRSRLLPWMLGLSLAAHFVLIGSLWVNRRVHAINKHGVIAVEFIQEVHHEPTVSRKTVATKLKKADVKQKAEEKPATPEALPFDKITAERETNAYIISVARLINDKKIYPKEAVDREQEGRVVVGLTLSASGEKIQASIEEASPFQLLNDAALKTVAAVGKFPPVPLGVGVPLHLHIPLVFKVERN
jgi:TonB family protein